MKDIYEILHDLQITYVLHKHPAVFTVKEAEKYDLAYDCGKTKNLFLTNKAGDTYYLLIAQSTTRVNLKKVQQFVNEKKLSFASSEKLFEYLELIPGSVSPFGLINDNQHAVIVLIDKILMEEEKIGFHPNNNTATLVVKTSDFKRYLTWAGNRVFFLDVA